MISAIDEYRNLLYAFGTKDSRAALHEYRTSLTDLIAGGSDDGIDVVRPKAERAMKAADDLIKRLLDDLGTLEK